MLGAVDDILWHVKESAPPVVRMLIVGACICCRETALRLAGTGQRRVQFILYGLVGLSRDDLVVAGA
jgi:hypothetical protein